MKKFIEHFRNPQGKLMTAQAQALADEFGKIANGLIDSNGDKLFRYNRRTHNVELVNEHTDDLTETKNPSTENEIKYSIDASDNSDESTLHRIRNKIAAFIGTSDAPSKRRNKRITQFLEKLADIRIRLCMTREFLARISTTKYYTAGRIIFRRRVDCQSF